MSALDIESADALMRAVFAFSAVMFMFGLSVGAWLGFWVSDKLEAHAWRSYDRLMERREKRQAAAASRACSAPAPQGAVPLGNTGTTIEEVA